LDALVSSWNSLLEAINKEFVGDSFDGNIPPSITKLSQLSGVPEPSLFNLLRYFVTGRDKGIELPKIGLILGRDECAKRVNYACQQFKE